MLTHLVEPSWVKFVEAYKGMGLEGCDVRVSCWVWDLGFLFFHEEVTATLPEPGVGQSFRGVRVSLSKTVLRGD